MQREVQTQESKVWPKVAIIVLNWNGWQDTIECMESLQRITGPNYQIIVVDNGSTDGSMERIKAWAKGKQEVLTPEPIHPLYHLSHPPVKKPIPYVEYNRKEAEAGGNPELENSLMVNWLNNEAHLQNTLNNSVNPTTKWPLILIQTGANLGFAGGNNVGIRYALKRSFDYIFLLNNDTVISKHALLEMVENNEEKAGIIGPTVLYYDSPKIINCAGGKIDFWKGSAPHLGVGKIYTRRYKCIKEVTFQEASCMLIKKQVFETIGCFDEKYSLYWEDADFCVRALKAGYKILYVGHAKIWHKISRSSRNLYSRNRIILKNRIYFMKKHAKIYHWFTFSLFLTWSLFTRIFKLCINIKI